jgi:hypothetical protein
MDIVELRIGQPVEVQFSLVVWPARHQKWQIALVLRDILVLDRGLRFEKGPIQLGRKRSRDEEDEE